MKIIFLILMISLSLTQSLNETTNINKNKTDCHKYYNYDENTNTCLHKGFFPIYPLELIQLIFFFLTSAISTSTGLGGGSIYTSFLMLIENFPPNLSNPISNFLILVCSSITYYLGVKDKELNPKNNFVDYDFVLVTCPIILIGVKIGTILNKIMFKLFLTGILIVLSLITFKKILIKAIAQSEKEKQLELTENLNDKLVLMDSPRKSFISRDSFKKDFMEKEIHDIENMAIRWDRVNYIIIFLIMVIVEQLIEGNNIMPSLIGINRCSVLFWLIFFTFFGILVYSSYILKRKIIEFYEYKKIIAKEDNLSKIEFYEKDNDILIWPLLGGMMSGMIGIGGGIMICGSMFKYNADPKTVVSTANFIVIFSSISSTIFFYLNGQLFITFAVCMSIPCGIAAYLGNIYINEYINRTKKTAFLLYSLLCIMLIGSIILLYNSINNLIIDLYNKKNVFEIRNYCYN